MHLNRPAVSAIRVLLACLSATSCAIHHLAGPTPLGTSCTAAEATLAEDWRALSEARTSGAGCAQNKGAVCDALRDRIERLATDCPGNPAVALASAFLAFDERNFVRAQQLLDQEFSSGGSNPDAAVLRARIAMEQGNLPFALRFLEQQIQQTGDHAGLRETYASALYLAGRREEARQQLEIAQRLGAPAWRISYGLGLIEEAEGRYIEAKMRYEEALKAKPGWQLAESRLKALIASGKIAVNELQNRDWAV